MSAKWMGYFFDDATDLEGPALLLALAIADHADAEGRCWPGVHRLSRKIRRQERQTQALIKVLEQKGYLELQRFQGRGKRTIFQLKKVQVSAPFAEQERCNSEEEKGAISDTEKVQFLDVPLNKDEPSYEPPVKPSIVSGSRARPRSTKNQFQSKFTFEEILNALWYGRRIGKYQEVREIEALAMSWRKSGEMDGTIEYLLEEREEWFFQMQEKLIKENAE